MRCGGCGAKVGPVILERVLRRVGPLTQRGEVLVGLDAPDDAAVVAVPPGMALVQSVDFLRDFVGDPYLLGRIAAVHALGDLHAKGANPCTAQLIATIPWGAAGPMEETLFQLVSGALETFRREGVSLVGGHSAEGAELAAGFAVLGWAAADAVWRKGGLRPGDALILTKALGTGVILAAERRGMAPGDSLERAMAGMQIPAGAAAACLRRHGVTACTDVTGFGLIGHAWEMAEASGKEVEVRLESGRWPRWPGAVECLAKGVRSSLHVENRRRAEQVTVELAPDREVEAELGFDPQTAGGLLAGVPADKAEACVVELRALGYPDSGVIGTVVRRGSPDVRPVRIVA